MKKLLCVLIVISAFLTVTEVCAVETNSVADVEAAYICTISQRADQIVAKLGIDDTNKILRVRDVLVEQYRSLNAIHSTRDLQFQTAKTKELQAQAVAAAKPKLEKLHGEFLTKLSAELSPEQVDKVKDGLTYGVLPLTYGVYLQMYPELTEEQKTQIKVWLTEAREMAMDGSTSDEKHAAFGKYKGKINNYLSKAGYDAKKAEKNLIKTSIHDSKEK